VNEIPPTDTTEAPAAASTPPTEHSPDLDDLSAMEDTSHSHTSQKHEAWILIDNNLTVQKHKATILADCTNPLKSKDWLKCVHGFTQYNEPTVEPPAFVGLGDPGGLYLEIQDPVVTLVTCNDLDLIFVGIIQVIHICVSGTSMQQIPSELLHEPNINLHGQVLMLKQIDHSHQPVSPDWEWDGTFECLLHDLEGDSTALINPILQESTNNQGQTYVFKTEELCGIGTALFEWLVNCVHRIL